MTKSRLGCLTLNALIAFSLSLIFIALVYVFNGKAMFSPGDLSKQMGKVNSGGISSHIEINNNCESCHAVPFSEVGMSDLCVECHLSALDDFINEDHAHGTIVHEYTKLECFYCHTDHHGENGKTTFLPENVGIDHTQTGFILNSHYQELFSCTQCHLEKFSNFSEIICEECHQAEAPSIMVEHLQFFGTGCLACHDGIESYGEDFDHNKNTFSLFGSHAEIKCNQCHVNARTIEDLKALDQNCSDCHGDEDVHLGYLGQKCEECHTPTRWEKTSFSHDSTGWFLDGGHKNALCLDCHLDPTYLGASTDCVSCHLEEDKHEGIYGQNCELCHNTDSWTTIDFDHVSDFAKNCEGCHFVDSPEPHYLGQCSACHGTDAWLPATFDHNVAEATNCLECHLGNSPIPHYAGQCSACHVVEAWLPATFNHLIAGATDCMNCHSSDSPSNHYSGQCSACHYDTVWKPAFFNHSFSWAQNCSACHNNILPSNHFVGQCSTCHSTTTWKPASFSHTFPLNHEGANNNCVLCHPGDNYQSYTCYGCHEHNALDIAEKHIKHDIPNFANCMECHADGEEHDD